jgi:hypothetical protein
MKRIGRLFGIVILLTFLILAVAVMIPMLLVVDGIELIIRLFKKKGQADE